MLQELLMPTNGESSPPNNGSGQTWRLERLERDISDIRGDLKAGLREVSTNLSNIQSTMQGLQVSMPLTYVTRVDLSERLKLMDESAAQRKDASDKEIADIRTTMRQLIFAIIGALITGGLALLTQVIRLISESKT
jgi:hypothetical protein